MASVVSMMSRGYASSCMYLPLAVERQWEVANSRSVVAKSRLAESLFLDVEVMRALASAPQLAVRLPLAGNVSITAEVADLLARSDVDSSKDKLVWAALVENPATSEVTLRQIASDPRSKPLLAKLAKSSDWVVQNAVYVQCGRYSSDEGTHFALAENVDLDPALQLRMLEEMTENVRRVLAKNPGLSDASFERLVERSHGYAELCDAASNPMLPRCYVDQMLASSDYRHAVARNESLTIADLHFLLDHADKSYQVEESLASRPLGAWKVEELPAWYAKEHFSLDLMPYLAVEEVDVEAFVALAPQCKQTVAELAVMVRDVIRIR